MSPTLTIDAISAPGAWARAIAHTPQLAARDTEITRGAPPLSPTRAGEAEVPPTANTASPGDQGRAS